MQHREEQESSFTILYLEGEIDLHQSPTLRQLLKAKSDSKCPALVVNFSGVSYIDSSGLATFVEYYQNARKFSGRIAMTNMSARVRSVFDLVRLSEVFPIYPSLDEARTAFPAGA